MTTRIAAVDDGTYYHHESLSGDRFAPFFDAIVYAPDLRDFDFDSVDILIVTCRTNASHLIPCKAKFMQFLQSGGTVAAMGETNQALWLPAIQWTASETNYWWWREPGGDLGLRVAAPNHSLFEYVTLDDCTWHYHGYFTPPPGAESLVEASGHGSVLYEDKVTTNGRMIVTALDPFYHHGSHFMPATTDFLSGFLPWLQAGGTSPQRRGNQQTSGLNTPVQQ